MISAIVDRLTPRQINILVALLVLLPVVALALTVLWMTAVPGQSFAGPLPQVTRAEEALAAELRRDVEAIATVPHNVAHPRALEASARHIEGRLVAMGYAVRRQGFVADAEKVRNIEAVLTPADPAAPTLVIGAHYDSYGNAPGANDNGSGSAAALALAGMLRDEMGKSRIRIRFVLFVNEEPPYFKGPLMGSVVYARALAASREPIFGMMSLETLGFYSDLRSSQYYPFPLSLLYPDTGNFVAFVGMVSSRSFLRETVGAFRSVGRIPSVGGTVPAFVKGVDWSDHWAFTQMGIPSLMITDTAPFRYRHYHSSADTPDKIDYARLARVVSGLELVIRRWSRNGMGG